MTPPRFVVCCWEDHPSSGSGSQIEIELADYTNRDDAIEAALDLSRFNRHVHVRTAPDFPGVPRDIGQIDDSSGDWIDFEIDEED